MKTFYFSTFLLIAAILFSCNENKEKVNEKTHEKAKSDTQQVIQKDTTMIPEAKTNEPPKPIDGAALLKEVESNPDNPEYIISVKNGGRRMGDIHIMLFPEIAPEHCRNFDSLVSIKFYNGTLFHRVIPNFMIQGGDPNSKNKPEDFWGAGDPSQREIPAEFNAIKHKPGIISAAREGGRPNSATSQFFICVNDLPRLDGKYTVYGKVTKGYEIAEKISLLSRDRNNRPDKKVSMKIKRVKK